MQNPALGQGEPYGQLSLPLGAKSFLIQGRRVRHFAFQNGISHQLALSLCTPSLSFLNISKGCAQVAVCSSTKAQHWEDSAGATDLRVLFRID